MSLYDSARGTAAQRGRANAGYGPSLRAQESFLDAALARARRAAATASSALEGFYRDVVESDLQAADRQVSAADDPAGYRDRWGRVFRFSSGSEAAPAAAAAPRVSGKMLAAVAAVGVAAYALSRKG